MRKVVNMGEFACFLHLQAKNGQTDSREFWNRCSLYPELTHKLLVISEK